MTATFLGALIKALDVDLTTSAFTTAVLFAIALFLGWNEAHGRARRLLLADIGLYVVIGLITGNVTWMLYLGGGDPLTSLAHPAVRMVYLAGGPSFFALHVANALWPHRPWWRPFLCVLAWDVLLVGALVAVDLWGWL